MNTRLATKIIKKFLEGNCSDEEFTYLLYWYESFDESPDLQLNKEEKESLRHKILLRIRQNIPELEVDDRMKAFAKTEKTHKAITFGRWLRYAAAAAVIGIVTLAGIHYSGNEQVRDQKNMQEWQASNLITLDNNSNRMHLVILPDSSKVWLSPHSRLKYPETFILQERKVELSGEAFFEIYKDASRPFIVVSGEMITKVLGTSFLLKACPDKPVEIAVMTGKVAVSTKDKKENKITLTSNQKAVLNLKSGLIKETKADKTVVQRWQKVNLFFNNIPFEQVIQALDKKFNIHIYCKEEDISQYKLNADFNNQNLTNILEMLEKSLNIHYEMVNDSVINFYKNKAL